MTRLGHISLFGLAFINLAYALTVRALELSSASVWPSRLFIVGAVTMPLICYLSAYRKSYREHHGVDAPPPLTGDLMFCHPDATRAEELARQYMSNYFLTIVNHYELMSDHFKEVKGYDNYASAVDLFQQVGVEPAALGYCAVQSWGTPDQILEKLRRRRELLDRGDTRSRP